jgi:RNA polymerase sigma-B factor
MASHETGQGEPRAAVDAADGPHEDSEARADLTPQLDGVAPAETEVAAERARAASVLFARMQSGDTAARDALIERFLPLARQLARRYQRAAEPLDDLVQVASIGLVKAVDRFDPGRGVAFSSYAVPTILGELKRYFRDSGWAVHVPRGMQERAMQVDRAVKELAGRLGRSPSVDEVAEHAHASVEDVLGAMEAAQAYEAVSLDSERGSRTDAGADTFADGIGEADERYDLVEYGASIAPAVRALSARDRLILHLRFVDDMTQSQIAERIGVSQMQVSRLIRRSLSRLREAASAGD